jgi:hypothetical protein
MSGPRFSKKELDALRPIEITGYLKTNGWILEDQVADKAAVFRTKTSDNETEHLTVPLKQHFADYALRISEILDLLARHERRPSHSILTDLSWSGSDIIRLRVADEDSRSILFDDGLSVVDGGHDLLQAAACSAVKAKGIYDNYRPKLAKRYMEGVRLGHTEQGSFVFTLISPLPIKETSAQTSLGIEFEPNPFSRKVTETLSSGLNALTEAIATSLTTDDFVPFKQAVSKGVSANLCEAIADMADAAQKIEIGVSWAQAKPNGRKNLSQLFGSASASILRDVAKEFKKAPPPKRVELTGIVTNLHRGPEEMEGRVTLKTEIEGRTSHVNVVLDRVSYSSLVRAHDNSLSVKLTGDLTKTKTGWELQDPECNVISG